MKVINIWVRVALVGDGSWHSGLDLQKRKKLHCEITLCNRTKQTQYIRQ